MPKLMVYSGGTVTEVPLGNSAVMGRQKSSEIYIDDPRASRKHARVVRAGDGYYVEDLNSRNGTLHNGKLIEGKIPLSHGDEIVLCDTKMVFVVKAASPARAAVPSALPKRPMVTFTADAADAPAAVNVSIEADVNKLAEAASGDVSALKRSHEHLRTMIEVSNVLATIHDPDELLGAIMDQMFEIFPQADNGFIMLKEEGTDDPMDLREAVVRKRGKEGAEEIKMSRTVIGEVATKRRAVICSDTLSDDRFLDRMSIIDLKIRSMMCVPMLWREEFLGLVHVDTTNQARAFKQNDLELLTGIAQQAAAAIKNARLIMAVENETRIRSNLQRHFSPALVEKVVKGDADIMSSRMVENGTVFFSDIIGFTTMSEILSPPEVVHRLNRYFEIVEEVVFRYGGIIDSFGGDSTLAHWGVLEDQKDAAVYAICAAVEIQNALFKFNRKFPDTRQRPIRLGIGLNTGGLVAGNIGSDQKVQYTVIGDAVNVAQRIESLAGRGQVFVGEQTYKELARVASVVKLPPMEVKGKAQKLTVFSVRTIVPPESKGEELLSSIPAEIGVHGEGTPSRGVVTGVKRRDRSALELTAFSEAPVKGGAFVQLALKPQLKPSLPTFTCKVLVSGTDEASSVGECVLRAERVPKDVLALFTPGSVLSCDVGPEEIVRK